MKRLLSAKVFNPGNKVEMADEPIVDNVGFSVYKFSKRPKPTDPSQIITIGCFSEFGCEIVGTMYCIPALLKKHPDKYVIVVGWYGREYLYRHLVDEFWEINEEFMWLREYARAFHNESKNLKNIEKRFAEAGEFFASDYLGRLAVGATCNACGAFWGEMGTVKKCENCGSPDVNQSFFGDVKHYKKQVTRIPAPCEEKLEEVKQHLGKNPVGIFARNRKCYGRNLQPEFYKGLISLLESKGYTPIWLGEKQSTLACPVDHIVDFSRMEASRDLENTLAIVKQLKFTIQFWTASSRLAAIMGTPYILFESPDQIWGNGQEGFRLNLTAFGPRKLVLAHYLNVLNDNTAGLQLVERAIDELDAENYEEMFGLLEHEDIARGMKNDNNERIGG